MFWSVFARDASDRSQPECVLSQHSDFLYWWVVWLAAATCGAITHVAGEKVDIGALKPVTLIQSTWLAMSFIGLVGVVVIATNAKLKGAMSLLVLTLVAFAMYVSADQIGMREILDQVEEAQVFANEAFYIALSLVLLFCWLVILGMERYPRVTIFKDRIIEQASLLSQPRTILEVSKVKIEIEDSDWIVNYGFGFPFLLLGPGLPGDARLTFTTSDNKVHTRLMKNVIGVKSKKDTLDSVG